MNQALQEHLRKNGVKRLRKNDHPEQREQMAYINWLRIKHPEVITLVCPVVKYAGNEGQRIMQGGIQKRMGYIAGTLDIFHCIARGGFNGLVIEMKVKGNSLSDEQKEMIQRLKDENYLCFVCYSSDEAIQVVTNYLKMERRNFFNLDG